MGNEITIAGNWAKPVNTLIKKMGEVMNVWLDPIRILRTEKAEAEATIIKAKAEAEATIIKAKAEAEATIINVQSQLEVTALQQRAFQRVAHEETINQENIESIAKKSFDSIKESARPEEIDNDWLRNFFDECKTVSNKDMQTLWSALLSNEANSPGSISKRTVKIFAMMDKSDAELYTKLLTYGWVVDKQPVIMIDDCAHNIYNKNNINFTTLNHLDNIGLIKFNDSSYLGAMVFNSVTGFVETGLPRKTGIFYYGNLVNIEFNHDDNNQLSIGDVLLTQVGLELMAVAKPSMDSEYFSYMKAQLKKRVTIS